VATLQSDLTAAAKLNPGNFWVEHPAISRNQPEQVTSLGKTGEPISIHWKDGPDAKVLIRNLDRMDGAVGTEHITETILAHIKRFQQDDLPFPKEIYLDIRKRKPSQHNLDDFENKLVEGINELNNTNYEIKPEEIDEGYIKLNLRTRQAEESISSSLIELDSDSEGIELSTPLIRRQNQKEDLDRSDDQGAPRSAIRSGAGEDERPRDQAEDADADIAILPKLASKILTGAQVVRDEALGLSEGNMQLLEGLKGMYDNLLQTKRRLLDLEHQIEATLPPVLPLETVIGFQPDFRPLSAQTREEARQLAKSYKTINSPGARNKLEGIFSEGLKPADSLKGKGVALSGDEKVASVVSVNVLPFTGDAKKKAEFVATYRAGGAIPIALEQKGDNGTINPLILTQRAVDSAVLIIDPNGFDPEQAQQVQQSQGGGGGELGLSGVKPGAIVAALLPATMSSLLNDKLIERRRIHFVGAVNSSVYYAGAKKNVELSHPDYQSALEKIFTDNPKKTLLVHTTRLGNPRPITK
jgi:hypothetical protein